MYLDLFFKYGFLVIAYLLGAIPFSIVLGKKFKGIDVRDHGSGNPGGTNSLRYLGRKIGGWVLFLDGFKAFIIIFLMQFNILPSDVMLHPLAYGLAAAVGHVYSIYIGFKGGKAVAATVGMMIAFNPLYAFIMMIMFYISLKLWRYVSLSSSTAVFTSVIIGVIVGVRGGGWDMLLYTSLLLLLVLFRHRSNFQRIKNGTEAKVGDKPKISQE